MTIPSRRIASASFPLLALSSFAALSASAQSGNAGTVRGTVTDPSGAVIPNAAVHLTNKVSGFDRTTTTDATGQFSLLQRSLQPLHNRRLRQRLCPSEPECRDSLFRWNHLNLVLQIAGASQTVTVESGRRLD